MNKTLVIVILVLFIVISIIISPIGGKGEDHNIEINDKTEIPLEESCSVDNDTEYWALLIHMGIYAGHPDQNFPPEALEYFEKLPNQLLISEHWKEENIKVITGRRAFLLNIVRGFRWLDKKEDENDISVVYISTHGGPLNTDKWPKDEWDGRDEVLATYLGFILPWVNIRDDFLNLLLSFLESKGTCVMIDSCHAGGFNDTPYSITSMNNNMNADEWMYEFAEDIRNSGRVVLMACSEDELSYGRFTYYLIPGLTGYADANEDDLVSAEEVFEYIVEKINGTDGVNPTIFDDYPGELYLTEVEFPLSIPSSPIGTNIGDTKTTYDFSMVSTNPGGDKISYG